MDAEATCFDDAPADEPRVKQALLNTTPSRLMRYDKDKHNAAVSLSLIVYCFSHYRYRVWQGSDCVAGTCVPSETNTGAGLICWMISNPAVVPEPCGREKDERVDS